MFASKKLSLNEWKNWAIGLVGNTMSSIDQATSRWFLNLINGLPRDYFAKTFDQVNYLDKRVWEGMFRANIEEIKEQLELRVSESIVEANLVKLQGLVGKYSLSPVTYEDGLKELEDFISTFGNGDNYLKILREARNEFREELKSQPVLLKECIESEVNLERKEGAYYKSLLDDRSLKNTSPERVISESPILDKAAVSKRGNNNYKLRNISKLLFSNPGQALTLFLAAQSAFASAANIQMSNSTGLAIGNDTLSFDNNLSNLSEFEERINENVSLHSISKSGNFRNSNKVRKEVEVVERGLNGRFTEIRDEFKDLRDTGELVEVLTYVKSQRSKRAANELDSEMETVPENQEEIIIGLENKVRELKKEIEEIKNSSSASDERYTEQISLLEGQLIVLQRFFNDMKRQSSQTLSEKANEIKGLSAIVKNLRKQVEDLNKKIQENERKYLYVECAKDIEARKFKDAEEELKQINNETETSNVVKQVYSGRINNFPLLLEFGKSIGDAKLKFWVYESLSVEMENTQPIDLPKTAELAKALRIGCIDRTNVPNDIRGKARGIFEKLRSLVVGANDLCHATTMHHAAEMGDLDVVRLLIDGRAYVDYQDQQLKTPLYYAAEMGNLDVVRLLIDKGADVNHRDQYLQTPLYFAAEEGKLDVVRLLIDKGADVNHQDEYLHTPLHHAAEMGKLDVVRLLIDSGAYVDSKGRYFETPLQFAAKGGKLDVVRLLIDKGADVNHRDQQSITALEYATSNSRFDVVKFLKEKQGLRSRRDVKELGNVSNSTLGSLQESVKPSSYVSDIVLEKTKESNSSFVLK